MYTYIAQTFNFHTADSFSSRLPLNHEVYAASECTAVWPGVRLGVLRHCGCSGHLLAGLSFGKSEV